MIYRHDEPRKAKFSSEAGLCKTFIWSLPAEWLAYPETCGFDIVLVRESDGVQLGIEAKLTLNAKVLSQIVEPERHYADGPKPDFRAVLVPYGTAGDLSGIARLLGLTVIEQFDRPTFEAWAGRYGSRRARLESKFRPTLPTNKVDHWTNWQRDWIDWCPSRRLDLPDYVPDVVAGASGPVQLTSWKVKAIKIAILLERRGYVVREDFTVLQISHYRWIDPYSGWLVRSDERGRYLAGDRIGTFKAQHPRNYEEIAADFKKWDPTAAALKKVEENAEKELARLAARKGLPKGALKVTPP